MLEQEIKLIAGLGNPGKQYAHTRHNVGFMVLDDFAKRQGFNFKQGKQAEESLYQGRIFIKPLSYMNLSGG
ncbi:MAG: aminoacyl-tRNA hydrolase [Deinococcales bacterium]